MKSRRTRSSNSSPERPEICHRPVIPGRTSERARCQSSSIAWSRSGSGRGPTRLISPRRTLTSCGSSSSERRRSTRPTRVTRGSSRILKERARRLVLVLELVLALGRIRDHGAELEHPELLLADADAPVDVEHGPARVELDRRCDEQPERDPDHEERERDDQVERALRRPLDPRQHRRPQLEQRHALAGDVLALVDEELGRGRSELDLHPVPMGELDDLEDGLLVEVRLGEHELVRPLCPRAAPRAARATRRTPPTRARRPGCRRPRRRSPRATHGAAARDRRACRPRRRAAAGDARPARPISSSETESYAARRSPIASALVATAVGISPVVVKS